MLNATLLQRPALATVLAAVIAAPAPDQTRREWAIHDPARPMARVVDPGTASTPGQPPGDAVVLFDGTGLAKWVSEKDGAPARWRVEDGVLEVAKGAGGIRTRDSFGDCQLHLEWMSPNPPAGQGQDRGNSGVFLMGRYEVQVLDSWQSATYADGQAGALYGQFPPLVNAARKPGEWQSYDIVFEAPRFDASGALRRPARVTVFLNGVLVHHARELTGPTAHKARPPYAAHPSRLPLSLQDHAHPVRFRNIWIRALPEDTP
jgi:hypothetical protein